MEIADNVPAGLERTLVAFKERYAKAEQIAISRERHERVYDRKQYSRLQAQITKKQEAGRRQREDLCERAESAVTELKLQAQCLV
eukprot:COSAG02_NODE_30874_length_543_cov_1.619369_2_plen_84_part_01